MAKSRRCGSHRVAKIVRGITSACRRRRRPMTLRSSTISTRGHMMRFGAQGCTRYMTQRAWTLLVCRKFRLRAPRNSNVRASTHTRATCALILTRPAILSHNFFGSNLNFYAAQAPSVSLHVATDTLAATAASKHASEHARYSPYCCAANSAEHFASQHIQNCCF